MLVVCLSQPYVNGLVINQLQTINSFQICIFMVGPFLESGYKKIPEILCPFVFTQFAQFHNLHTQGTTHNAIYIRL